MLANERAALLAEDFEHPMSARVLLDHPVANMHPIRASQGHIEGLYLPYRRIFQSLAVFIVLVYCAIHIRTDVSDPGESWAQ